MQETAKLISMTPFGWNVRGLRIHGGFLSFIYGLISSENHGHPLTFPVGFHAKLRLSKKSTEHEL